MSIAVNLGVESPSTPALESAARRWQDWVGLEPDLDVGVGLVDLEHWSWTRDPRTDDVLRALAKLGSAEGHDDPLATTVLAWLFIPGARSVARQASTASTIEVVDELTATALWVACREVDWARSAPIACRIIRTVRRAVQAELGFGEGCKRADRTWSLTCAWDPQVTSWEAVISPAESSATAAEELLEFLDQATEAGVVTPSDCQLLVDIAIATDELDLAAGRRTRARRQACGLGSRPAATIVARRIGVAEVTVRRRLQRCLRQLSDFATTAPAHA